MNFLIYLFSYRKNIKRMEEKDNMFYELSTMMFDRAVFDLKLYPNSWDEFHKLTDDYTKKTKV